MVFTGLVVRGTEFEIYMDGKLKRELLVYLAEQRQILDCFTFAEVEVLEVISHLYRIIHLLKLPIYGGKAI